MAENKELREVSDSAQEVEMETSAATPQGQDSAEVADLEKGKGKKKPGKGKKLRITIGVIAIILIVAGAGFWKWHETPQFCNAFCHNMDPYYDTYSQEQGVEGADKWGKAVSNTNAAMATLHRTTETTAKSEMGCLDCHQPVLTEQISEGFTWMAGNYYTPLDERTGENLTEASGLNEDQFCSNGNCHVYLQGPDGQVNHDKLAQVTSDLAFNPHEVHHDGVVTSCTSCHKGHRASVYMCTACHDKSDGIQIPEGWISYQESQELIAAEYGR